MMIRAIIFDFGRVITAQKPLSLFGRYEKDLGLMPGTINPIMFGSQVWQDALLGRKTMKEFWHAIGPQLRLKTPGEIDAFRHRYHADEAIINWRCSPIRRRAWKNGLQIGKYSIYLTSFFAPGMRGWSNLIPLLSR
jgi:hypothetical protein